MLTPDEIRDVRADPTLKTFILDPRLIGAEFSQRQRAGTAQLDRGDVSVDTGWRL